MNTPTTLEPTTATQAHADPEGAVPHHRPRPTGTRRYAIAAAIAAAVLVAVTILTTVPDPRPSAAATVEKAATGTGQVTNLRIRQTRHDQPGFVSDGEIAGPDFRVTYLGDDGPTVMTKLGATVWETVDGTSTSQPYDPVGNGALAPFGQASEAVIRAALADSEIETVGTEPVGDVETTRYRILPSDSTRSALTALGPAVLNWFQLFAPEDVTELSVWVADDLVHRVQVTADWGDGIGTRTTDYFDFNADITITPPS